jgi:prepilin-type N-terminal cleavage/methylation domain-containing protein
MTRLRILRRLGRQGGYTLIELLLVCAILGTVLASLSVLFVSASGSQIDMNRRFRAQQDARVAVDKMRREIHCASAITPAGNSSAITVTLPGQCPTAVGLALTTVVYDMQLVSAGRWQLRRAGVKVADYVTAQNVFTYTAPATGKLGNLRVELPVNVRPNQTGLTWRLVADIVLRNTTRL